MPEESRRSKLLQSGLEYNDYLFMAVGLDAEWSRPATAASAKEALDNTCKRFSDVLVKDNLYADTVASQLHSGNNVQPEWESLYQAICYLTIGHADVLGLVLVDDFSVVQTITAKIDTTVEELAIGACPKVGCLRPSPGGPAWNDWGNHLLNGHDFFAKIRTASPAEQKRPPAVAVTRIKLTGLATLGLGLKLQHAVFRAAAKVIAEMLGSFSGILTAGPQAHQESLQALEISPTVLANTWFTIVDLFGVEEVGIVCSTPNLSIPASVAARLECLTLADLYAQDGSLGELLKDLDYQVKLKEVYAALHPSQQTGKIDAKEMSSTHICRWARTTVGTWPDYPLQGGSTPKECLPISGWTSAVTEVRIASGHRNCVDETLDGWLKGAGKAPGGKAAPNVKFRLHGLGRADLLLDHGQIRAANDSQATETSSYRHSPGTALVPFEHLLRQVFGMVAELTDSARIRRVRDLVGASSFISIPVPVLPDKDGRDTLLPHYDEKRHYGFSDVVLPEIKKALRGEAGRAGSLSPQHLADNAMQYGMPEALVNNLQCLFHDFINQCTNPMTFDAVLDLYDAYAALHKTVCELLPDAIKESIKGNRFKSCQIDYQRAQQLAHYLNALDRTMRHRLHQAFPEDMHRDMDADYRGGLHAIQYAADSVLKCGAGLFRRHVLLESEKHQATTSHKGPTRQERHRIGIISVTDFEPGIVNTLLHLGTENRPAGSRLAFVRMDVPHTLHQPSYLDILHETFHLAYEYLRGSPHNEVYNPAFTELDPAALDATYQRPILPTVPHGSALDQHLEEIFVNLLTVLLICPDAPDRYKEHFMLQFASYLRWGLPNEEAFKIGLSNKLLRVFYIIELGNFVAKNPGNSAAVFEEPSEELNKRFESCAEMALTYLPLSEFSDAAALRKGIVEHSKCALSELQPVIRELLKILAEVGGKISTTVWSNVSDRDKFENRASNEVTPSDRYNLELELGKQLIDWRQRSGGAGFELKRVYCAPIAASEMIASKQPIYGDPFVLVAQVLRQLMEHRNYYLKSSNITESKPHVPLGVSISTNYKHWYASASDRKQGDYWVSMTSPSLVCTSVEKRCERLRLHIISLKSLWDVSSYLRAERFSDLLNLVLESHGSSPKAPVSV